MNTQISVVGMKIKVKATGEEKIAIYATTPAGHKRNNVDGKFYTDKRFYQLFEIIQAQIFK